MQKVVKAPKKSLKDKINPLLLVIFMYLNTLVMPLIRITGNGIIVWILTFLIIILFLLNNHNQLNRGMLLLTSILLATFLINFSIFDFRHETWSIFIEFIKFGFITFILASSIKDYTLLLKTWYFFGILNIIIWLFFINEINDREISYMFFGKQMTLSFIIFIIYYYKKGRKLIDLALLLLSMALIILFSNRSSLLICLVLFIVFEFNSRKNYRISLRYIRGVGFLSLFLLIYYKLEEILNILIEFASTIGINSYILQKMVLFVEGKSDNSLESRDLLTSNSINFIKNNNFMPNGIGYYQNMTDSPYPHNIFLDIFISFGFIGVPILFTLIIWGGYKYFKSYHSEFRTIILSLFIYCLVRLNFSGTFWDETVFFTLIGLLFSLNLNRSIVFTKNETQIPYKT